MREKPELIAKLQVGAGISGECSACHEVIVVLGESASDAAPRALDERLKQAFEEHVRKACGTVL